MNLFVRYFSHECLAKSVDEAIAFLKTIPEIKFDEANAVSRLTNFLVSPNYYPYRLKVSYNNYVLFLKTDAENLDEFKDDELRRKKQAEAAPAEKPAEDTFQGQAERKKKLIEALQMQREGWYNASIIFKRVVLNPESKKFQYFDTSFRVRCKAGSAMQCYERMVDYLKSRADIDPRSQFPSVKSQNFEYTYLGENAE